MEIHHDGFHSFCKVRGQGRVEGNASERTHPMPLRDCEFTRKSIFGLGIDLS